MYRRYKWDIEVKFVPEEMNKVRRLKPGSRVFICSTHDIMGDWIPNEWINKIIDYCKERPGIDFMFLTKNGLRYQDFKFPVNCWLGSTITNDEEAKHVFAIPTNIQFISFEPLVQEISWNTLNKIRYMDWIIVGGLTPKPMHEKEWVEQILVHANTHDIPVFLKHNLHYPRIREEYPRMN